MQVASTKRQVVKYNYNWYQLVVKLPDRRSRMQVASTKCQVVKYNNDWLVLADGEVAWQKFQNARQNWNMIQ